MSDGARTSSPQSSGVPPGDQLRDRARRPLAAGETPALHETLLAERDENDPMAADVLGEIQATHV
ncbi:MAG TPA: hypothetical protein VJ901_00220 [Thermoanaerobaculia bacterium]|nr:hypothetical protein [Thermoanaerobaculia bacterium]